MALSGESCGDLGLQRGDGYRTGGYRRRGQDSEGPVDGSQEWFFLRNRSNEWEVDLGRALREGKLGGEDRSSDWPSDRSARCAVPRQFNLHTLAWPRGRTQLGADGVQSYFGSCLYPRSRVWKPNQRYRHRQEALGVAEGASLRSR